jgi:putative ABC transport system substrate-binding protein
MSFVRNSNSIGVAGTSPIALDCSPPSPILPTQWRTAMRQSILVLAMLVFGCATAAEAAPVIEFELDGTASNNSFATAQTIPSSAFTLPVPPTVFDPPGDPTAALFGRGGGSDVDIFRISGHGHLILDVDNELNGGFISSIDTELFLWNSSGVLLDFSEDGPNGPPPFPADLARQCPRRAARRRSAAAGATATDRRADGLCRDRPGRTDQCRGVPGGSAEARVGRGSQQSHRHSLADTRRVESMQRFAKELVALQPDVILSHITPTTAALLKHTRTIPIVFATVSDPVGTGFVASFHQPGGNVTGFTSIEPTMAGKWVQLVKEVAPRVVRVAFLFNPATAPYSKYFLTPLSAAAASLGVKAIAAPVADTATLTSVVAAEAREPNSGLIVCPDSFMDVHRAEVTVLAARHRLPAVYPFHQFTEVGGLLSYGNDQLDNYRRAAVYVDRILRGAQAAELPIQAPVKFQMVINLKTAKALGLTIPPSLLFQADQVIE